MLPNFDPFLIIWDFQGSDCFNISSGSKERFFVGKLCSYFSSLLLLYSLLVFGHFLCFCCFSFCVFVVLSHFLVLLAVSLCLFVVRPFLGVTQRKKAICQRLPHSHAEPDLCWWSLKKWTSTRCLFYWFPWALSASGVHINWFPQSLIGTKKFEDCSILSFLVLNSFSIAVTH